MLAALSVPASLIGCGSNAGAPGLAGPQGSAGTTAPGPPGSTTASATSPASSTPPSRSATLVRVRQVANRTYDLTVRSPAVGREVPVRVLLPRRFAREPGRLWPALYLLHGCCDTYVSWTRSTDIEQLSRADDVLVVMPDGGRVGLRFYSNCEMGRGGRRFTSPSCPSCCGSVTAPTTDRRSPECPWVAWARSATRPGTPAGSPWPPHSAASSTPILLRYLLGLRRLGAVRGGRPTRLWGDPEKNADVWAAHNPYALAPRLRGTTVFVSAGTGEPGPRDPPGAGYDTIEPAIRAQNEVFARRIHKLDLDTTIDLYGAGTHSWVYWQRELHHAWPIIRRGAWRRWSLTLPQRAESPIAGADGRPPAPAGAATSLLDPAARPTPAPGLSRRGVASSRMPKDAPGAGVRAGDHEPYRRGVVSVAQLGAAVDLRPNLAAAREALLDLLADLEAGDWNAATGCPGWSVRDVVAHLLHDDLRRLSRTRDQIAGPRPSVGETLPDFLNRANEQWVAQTRFLSPALLLDLLGHSAGLIQQMWAEADLTSLGEGVWWAGIARAPVWLDVAREYTEEWTHQQQIRDAVVRPGLTTPDFLDPALDTFLRALPHTYEDLGGRDKTTVWVTLEDGPRGLDWALETGHDGWSIRPGQGSYPPHAHVTLPAETLWRLATGGMSRQEAARYLRRSGDPVLAGRLLAIVAVVR